MCTTFRASRKLQFSCKLCTLISSTKTIGLRIFKMSTCLFAELDLCACLNGKRVRLPLWYTNMSSVLLFSAEVKMLRSCFAKANAIQVLFLNSIFVLVLITKGLKADRRNRQGLCRFTGSRIVGFRSV